MDIYCDYVEPAPNTGSSCMANSCDDDCSCNSTCSCDGECSCDGDCGCDSANTYGQ